MAAPVAGSSEFTFLADLREAFLAFFTNNLYWLGLSNKLDVLVTKSTDIKTDTAGLKTKLDTIHADNVAILAKLEQIRVLLALP